MTTEERIAFYKNHQKKSNIVTNPKSKNNNSCIFQLKFIIAVLLFIIFLSLDYTGYKIYHIGSTEIIREIRKDSPSLKQVASKF